MTDSPIKSSSYKAFLASCDVIGEENVLKILSLIKESQIKQVEDIKNHIINVTTSRFDVDNNFFRKKRITYTITHNSLCFAVILFQLRKYFTLSYKAICEELHIKPKNTIWFYYKKLNALNEKNDQDKYYINLISEIDSDIKNYIDKVIKNNTHNGKDY